MRVPSSEVHEGLTVLTQERRPSEFLLGHDDGPFREDPAEVEDIQETIEPGDTGRHVISRARMRLANQTRADSIRLEIDLPLMVPDQDRALSFAILSQGHEPVQVFPTLDLEFDTDQGVT